MVRTWCALGDPWSPPASPRTARRSPHFLEAANFWGVRHFSRPQPFTFSRTLSSAACPLEPPANPRSARKSPHFSKVAGFGGSDRSLRTSSTAVLRTLPSAAGRPGTPMVSSETAKDPPWAPSAPLRGRRTQFERRPARSFPAPASAGFVHWSHPPIPFFSRRGGEVWLTQPPGSCTDAARRSFAPHLLLTGKARRRRKKTWAPKLLRAGPRGRTKCARNAHEMRTKCALSGRPAARPTA